MPMRFKVDCAKLPQRKARDFSSNVNPLQPGDARFTCSAGISAAARGESHVAFFAKRPDQKAAQRLADLEATVAAIDRSQAMIEFQLDGTIITANKNFLTTVGYSLDEIVGRHHGMFVDPAYGRAPNTRPSGPAWARRVLLRQVPAGRQGRQGRLDPGKLQPDLRRRRQALQGHQVRHRHHRGRAGARSPTKSVAARPRPRKSAVVCSLAD
jgi:PAS domain-containing protein